MHERDVRKSHEEVAVIQEVERKMWDAEVKELMGEKTELMGGDCKGHIMWVLEALAKHLGWQESCYSFEEKGNIIQLKVWKDHLVWLCRQETNIEVVRLIRRPLPQSI